MPYDKITIFPDLLYSMIFLQGLCACADALRDHMLVFVEPEAPNQTEAYLVEPETTPYTRAASFVIHENILTIAAESRTASIQLGDRDSLTEIAQAFEDIVMPRLAADVDVDQSDTVRRLIDKILGAASRE